MTPNEYQKLAFVTANSLPTKDLILNGALGLNGEAGEVADVVKKHLFQGHELNIPHIKEELGDVMWYVALMCTAINAPLEDVMKSNIDKLKARFPDGFSAEASINR